MFVRSFLGFYPNHGDVTVRLRYRNDKIYATKVEGGGHVPHVCGSFGSRCTQLGGLRSWKVACLKRK